MDGHYGTKQDWLGLLGMTSLLLTSLAVPTAAQGKSAHRKDSETCASFGAHPGSGEYSRCMLAQQRRRDVAPLNAAEAQRASAEAARNNLETIRRMRCDREARRDRERGVQPRFC